MTRLFKTLICICLCAAFIGCAGHCLVESAFAATLQTTDHCKHHSGQENQFDDAQHSSHSQTEHHHESPCASTLSLLSKTNILTNSIVGQTNLARMQPEPIIAITNYFQVAVSDEELFSFLQLLHNFSQAPNAPPAFS